jgi:acetyl esterase/lipase
VQAEEVGIEVERDIAFGRGGDVDLRLDISHPVPNTSKRMAILHLHGGGFRAGSKDDTARTAPDLARLGYVGIGVQYRLAQEANWPGQLHDVKAAIRWTRANADRLEIDPDRIAVAGYSAGGLMALFAAATQDLAEFDGDGGTPGVSTRIAACVGFYPATATPGNMIPSDAGASVRAAADLDSLLSETCAPTLLFHGVADTTIRIESSQELFQKLRDRNVTAEFHAFDGAEHVFVTYPEFALATARLSDLFFDRIVLNPRTFPFATGGGEGRGGRGGRGGV